MSLSLKASITTMFTAIAMMGVIASSSAQDLNEAYLQEQAPIGYCDSECNTHLGGLGKMAKALIDSERKKHEKSGYSALFASVDDPILDDVYYDVSTTPDQIVIVASANPDNLA